ncbi:hypothetical protein L596_024237 [Steinernema carpocapsae]|uniref:WH1 domain-containing protein n=1 Tax=Steinernema carpocapsae TaxID=34508 RepID=A0A4U5MG54_STECR|nr:hypothetical protein L596_024237 [Steinernema carpocapsae]
MSDADQVASTSRLEDEGGHNVGSNLLNKHENRRVFDALGGDFKSLCSGLARLFTVERRTEWDQLLFGVACYVRDYRHRKTSICFVSPGDFDVRNHETPHVLIEIPICPDINFQMLADDFIIFGSEGEGYGMEFVDEGEAGAFFQTVEYAQNVRRQNLQRHKNGREEGSSSSSSCSSSSMESSLSSADSATSTGRLTRKRCSPVSLIHPPPAINHPLPIEFPPPPVNERKPRKDLRCSFHRRDAIEAAPARTLIRISRFSSKKFVDLEEHARHKGDKARPNFFHPQDN